LNGYENGGKNKVMRVSEKSIPSTDYDGTKTSGGCGIIQLLG
jgi:hypothetical protein